MKFSTLAAAALAVTGAPVLAAKSFSASNLYYAAGLNQDQQTTLFTGLQSAGVKVLRVWLDGKSHHPLSHSGTLKGTSINGFRGLEPVQLGEWDDTVLNRLDDLMVNAHAYGIKLLISLYSFISLSSDSDAYGQRYGTGDFYTSDEAAGYFKNRIAHVLSHVNPHNNKSWAASSEYIFAFEAQNEAMNDDLTNQSVLEPWQCTMAGAIKDNLKGSDDILVATGGGGWLATSVLNGYYSCDAIDVISVHAYATSDFATSALQPYVEASKSAGKKLIMEEWGACYTDSSNNNCNGGSALDSGTRDSNIQQWAASITAAGLPWFYWQILPNEDAHESWDYEVGIDGVNWQALKEAGLNAGEADAAFDFSRWLL